MCPDEHERALRTQPTYEAEAEDTHEHADHFNSVDIFKNKYVDVGHLFFLSWSIGVVKQTLRVWLGGIYLRV